MSANRLHDVYPGLRYLEHINPLSPAWVLQLFYDQGGETGSVRGQPRLRLPTGQVVEPCSDSARAFLSSEAARIFGVCPEPVALETALSILRHRAVNRERQ